MGTGKFCHLAFDAVIWQNSSSCISVLFIRIHISEEVLILLKGLWYEKHALKQHKTLAAFVSNLPQRLLSSIGILPTNWRKWCLWTYSNEIGYIQYLRIVFSLTLGWLKDGNRSILITRWSSLLEHPNETVQPRVAVAIVTRSCHVYIMFRGSTKPAEPARKKPNSANLAKFRKSRVEPPFTVPQQSIVKKLSSERSYDNVLSTEWKLRSTLCSTIINSNTSTTQ